MYLMPELGLIVAHEVQETGVDPEFSSGDNSSACYHAVFAN